MSRAPLNCPNCKRPLGYRRHSGNVSFRATVEPGLNGASVWLVCGCGGRIEVEGVVPTLLSSTKAH